MNREEYAAQLESKNGYCECPELQSLYGERKGVEGLVGRYNLLKRNIDFDGQSEEDRTFIRIYEGTERALHSATDKYRESACRQIKSGNLVLRLHDAENFRPLRDISARDFLKLQNTKRPIITTHCNSCNQQVDVIRG